jgi:hypothetical protein
MTNTPDDALRQSQRQTHSQSVVGPEVSDDTAEACCPLVELRHYTLKPGRRDELIALFEEHFIESQEQCGMRVIGHFRQLDDPDAFIWLRGFATMEQRRQALEGFYSGPLWREHRTAANDTMLDSDNVLLLKPVDDTTRFRVQPSDRPAPEATEQGESDRGLVVATTYAFAAPVDTAFTRFFAAEVVPVAREAGATLRAQFVTEPSANTFPVLPVREGEHVFVWFASFTGEEAYAAYQAVLSQSQQWRSLTRQLQGWLSQPEDVLVLTPCRRSLLRHRSSFA